MERNTGTASDVGMNTQRTLSADSHITATSVRRTTSLIPWCETLSRIIRLATGTESSTAWLGESISWGSVTHASVLVGWECT